MSQTTLKEYKLTPPKNLAQLHKTNIGLGYPDFYPPKHDQEEELMTEHNVKHGFADKPIVSNEYVSAHDILLEKIKDPERLQNLSEFMTDIMKRKQEIEINALQGSSSYTVPQTVWGTPDDRDKWLKQLAGNVPLRELVKKVPKGVDGTNLLELVTQYRVPLARATWFTKIVGINLTHSDMHRSLKAPTGHTKNWTQAFCTFIQQQSKEYDPEKWRYSISLAKWQFDEGLFDQRLLREMLDNLDQADPLHTAIWLFLVQQFLTEFQRSRTLMRLLIEIILKKLQDIHHQTLVSKLEIVVKMLKNMLHALFLATPDMFVFPTCWNTYKDLLRRVLIEDSPTRFDTVSSRNMKRQRERYYELIRSRNEVFDEKKADIIGKRSTQELQRTRMINILDTISFLTDYQNLVVTYFRTNNKSQMLETELSIHIYTLCYWAVTNHRAGDYRVYSVCTILDIWKKEVTEDEERFRRQNLIQNSLMEFLDNYPFGNNGICEQEESEVVSRLFGELIFNGHFSHQRYLQRLIARGDMIKEKRESERSRRHLIYLRCFPLYNAELHHINQRRIILYGVKKSDSSDQLEYDNMVDKVKMKLPYMFEESNSELDEPIVDNPISDSHLALNFDRETLDCIKHATKFCQIDVIRRWLIPTVKSFVQNTPIGLHNWRNRTQPGSSLLNARQFSTIVQVIELAKDYNSLLEILLWVLENSMEKSLFQLIIDTFKRHEMIWSAMGKSELILETLTKKNEKGATDLCITKYLSSLLPETCGEKKLKLERDLQSFTFSKLTQVISRHRNRFTHLSGFRVSSVDYRVSQSDAIDGYLYKIFESYTEDIIYYSQNRTNNSISDMKSALEIFGDLFRDIGDITSDGFDLIFKKWIKNNIRADDDSILRNENCSWFLSFLVTLVARHLVNMDVVMEHLCERNLNRLWEKINTHKQLEPRELIECKNFAVLLRLMLIQESGDNLCFETPLSTTEVQVLQYNCEILSRIKDFTDIMANIFQKLALIECWVNYGDPLVAFIQQLRIDFSKVYWFKQLCAVDVENIYRRFVKVSKKSMKGKEVEKRMIEMIQTSLSSCLEGDESTRSIASYTSYLENIFSKVNLWNIRKCRIEFWLFMDQIMLIGSNKHRSRPSPTRSAIKDEDGDVLMNLADQQINEDLKTAIIEFFWEELVFKAKIDRSILAYMIKDIREDVITEFLAYGFVVLKRCTELVTDIEEVFRALLLPLSDDKKLEFCVELLEQVEKIQEEFKGESHPNDSSRDPDRIDVYVSSIMSRVKLLVLGTHVLTGRVNAVVTSNNPEIAHKNKEYMLIFRWVIILVSLLCEQRIHRDGGGVAHFELLLDLVSFLLDDMGKNARAIFVAELKQNYKFEIPAIWSNRIKRVLPFTFNPETVGEGKKHVIDPWLKIECLGESDDLNDSPIDLSWYNAKVYPRPNKRLKRSDG